MDIENMSIPERLMAAVDCLKGDKAHTKYVRVQLRLMSRKEKLEKLKDRARRQAERAAKQAEKTAKISAKNTEKAAKIARQIAEQTYAVEQARLDVRVAENTL